MLRPRIEAIELHRPPHEGGWTVPAEDRPVVIAGPNGSGKSTLVEGVVACLFGSERRPGGAGGGGERRNDGRADADVWCRVQLVRGEDRFEIRRELTTGAVVVRSGDGAVHFEGHGEPRSRTTEGRRYRQLLADLLGVSDAEAFARTLFVRQGALSAPRLGDHLLQVAVGGHARVEAAKRDIKEAHRAVTARPLHDGDRPAVNPRQLEKVEEEMARLQERLESARAAGARRAPLALDRDRVGERLRQLSQEINRLEDAHAALVRGSAIEVSARQLKELTRKLAQLAAALPAATEGLKAAQAEAEARLAGGLYPGDFPERLARADLRWRDLARTRRRPPWWLAGAALVLAVTAAALLLIPSPPWAAALAGAGAAVAGAAWLALWQDARRTRSAVERELAELLSDVPGGATLGPDRREDAARAFQAQTTARRRLAEAREELAGTLREARATLRAMRSAGVAAATPTEAGPDADREREREPARRVAAEIGRVQAQARGRLLRERRELDRVGDVSLQLPDGVVPTQEGVAEALHDRREERRRVQDTLQEVAQELLERGTPAESLDALEAALSALAPRREALLLKAEVLETAHALLTDAYDAFRATDQDRLVGLISGHVSQLTGGEVGPVVVEGVLEEARVHVGDRLASMQSPPLSFGELHSLSLAVRLGAADFLGGLGVFPPLILDEPFAHLDPARAAAVWAMLEVVARERQVIITTQDTLLLSALGVEPDILLGVAGVTEPTEDTAEPMPAA
jgi:energy-coupling factor transporter ATP-binding protein EcfA2